MTRSKYEQVWDGDEFPVTGPFDLACCDCNLVHTVRIRVRDGKPYLKLDRNDRSTAALRRHHKRARAK